MSSVDLSTALMDMWRSVLLFVPTAVAFLAVVLVGFLLARMIRTVVTKGLRRVGFDRAVEHGGVGRVLRRTRYDAIEICATLAYYAVVLFTLQLAFGLWGPNPISTLINSLLAWLPRAFVAVVIIVVTAAIASAVRDLVQAALGGLSYGRVVGGIASAFILGLGIIAALEQVGIATAVTTPLLIAVLATVSGVLIVGVGGGLVRPMQRRWEAWLDRAAVESQVIRERAQAYADARATAAAQRPADPAPAEPSSEQTQVIRVETGVPAADGDATQSIYPVGTVADRQAGAASADETQVIGPEQFRRR